MGTYDQSIDLELMAEEEYLCKLAEYYTDQEFGQYSLQSDCFDREIEYALAA